MNDFDDLLQPTISRDVSARRKPWRVNSQFWVAFFGGPLPGGLIAFLNANRLSLGRGARRTIIVATLVATVVMAVAMFYAPEWLGLRPATAVRVLGRICGALLWWLVLSRVQREADVLRNAAGDAEYASLWGPGIAAALLLGAAQNLAILYLAGGFAQ